MLVISHSLPFEPNASLDFQRARVCIPKLCKIMSRQRGNRISRSFSQIGFFLQLQQDVKSDMLFCRCFMLLWNLKGACWISPSNLGSTSPSLSHSRLCRGQVASDELALWSYGFAQTLGFSTFSGLAARLSHQLGSSPCLLFEFYTFRLQVSACTIFCSCNLLL